MRKQQNKAIRAARNNLARMYAKDAAEDAKNNVESIKSEMAARLFFHAAQQDYAVAQVNIGRRFEKGLDGVPQNSEEAYYWYGLALRDPDHLNETAEPDNFAATVTEWRENLSDKMKLTPKWRRLRFVSRLKTGSRGSGMGRAQDFTLIQITF